MIATLKKVVFQTENDNMFISKCQLSANELTSSYNHSILSLN